MVDPLDKLDHFSRMDPGAQDQEVIDRQFTLLSDEPAHGGVLILAYNFRPPEVNPLMKVRVVSAKSTTSGMLAIV